MNSHNLQPYKGLGRNSKCCVRDRKMLQRMTMQVTTSEVVPKPQVVAPARSESSGLGMCSQDLRVSLGSAQIVPLPESE